MLSTDFQTHPVFRRGVAPHIRLLAYVAICVVMLVFDLRFHYLEEVRSALSVVTHPLQKVAAEPAHLVGDTTGYFSNLTKLKADNEQLREREKENAATLFALKDVEKENDRLRGLLRMAQRVKTYSVAAEVLYRAPDPYSRRAVLNLGAPELFNVKDPSRFVLDQGQRSGIIHGWPVVDADGLIGQITRVYPLQSEVTLITDRNQAVAVRVERQDAPPAGKEPPARPKWRIIANGVAFGTGRGQLDLRYVRANIDVQVGDRLVTSGLDGMFVPGLPVAVVVSVNNDTEDFARILCDPVSGVERSTHVLVLSRAELPPPPPNPKTGDPPPPPQLMLGNTPASPRSSEAEDTGAEED